jgi:hypothetical protein
VVAVAFLLNMGFAALAALAIAASVRSVTRR